MNLPFKLSNVNLNFALTQVYLYPAFMSNPAQGTQAVFFYQLVGRQVWSPSKTPLYRNIKNGRAKVFLLRLSTICLSNVILAYSFPQLITLQLETLVKTCCHSRLPLGVICLFIVTWLKNIFALVEFVIVSEDSIWVYSTCMSILKPNSSVS